MFVLIIAYYVSSGAALTSHEYGSFKACEVAGNDATTAIRGVGTQVWFSRSPKGN